MAGNFTNFGENHILDFLLRGQAHGLPSAWKIALGSAADDGSFTELAYTSYARLSKTRSLANFAGTHGAGTVLASTGTSHQTSNNNSWTFPTPSSSGGADANYIGFFDASSSGNCWIWFPLSTPIPIVSGTPIVIAAGAISFKLGLTGGMTDYQANLLIDLIFRGQTYTPGSTWLALFVAAPSNAGGGTEIGGGVGYERMELTRSTATWGSTQTVGSTALSIGSSGRVSNSARLQFPDPTADQGIMGWEALMDAQTAGNMLWWKQVTPQTIAALEDGPAHEIDTIGVTLD